MSGRIGRSHEGIGGRDRREGSVGGIGGRDRWEIPILKMLGHLGFLATLLQAIALAHTLGLARGLSLLL